MAITIPELNSVSVLDDTDNIMLTHSNGNSEKISGSALKADMIKDKIENNNGAAVSVNAVSTILATGTTITGPALGTGGNIKILFTAAISGTDTSTGLSLTYNGDAIAVKVGKDGSLEDFCAVEVSTNTYKYLQAYTTLELVFDGTYFIIVGNPVVLSSSTYTYYADGSHVVDSVTDGNKKAITSNAVYDFPINSITTDEHRPATSGAVKTAINVFPPCNRQGWNASHSFPLTTDHYYLLITSSPVNSNSNLYLVVARHPTLSQFPGYVVEVKKNQQLTVLISGDTLTISGGECNACLIDLR